MMRSVTLMVPLLNSVGLGLIGLNKARSSLHVIRSSLDLLVDRSAKERKTQNLYIALPFYQLVDSRKACRSNFHRVTTSIFVGHVVSLEHVCFGISLYLYLSL